MPEPRTFAGLLRASSADRTIYNSSVIGYALPDYLNVVEHFLPKHPAVASVVLSFCLNDVSHESASEIRTFLSETSDQGAMATLRANLVIGDINRYLRARSRLYLAFKNALTDPGLRTFSNDRRLYDASDADFNHMMAPLLKIADRLSQTGVRFAVVIAPAEPQLRSGASELGYPQQRLAAFLHEHGIEFVDPLAMFRERTADSRSLYLSGDAMHFSEQGHRLFATRSGASSSEPHGRRDGVGNRPDAIRWCSGTDRISLFSRTPTRLPDRTK